MNAILRKYANGVLLWYADPGVFRPYHAQKGVCSDLQRAAVLKAEWELLVLEVIVEHLELSGIGRTRIDDALRVIYRALRIERRKIGL